MRVLVSIYLNFLIAAVEKVDERRLIKVEMEILGELQAKDRIENQATLNCAERIHDSGDLYKYGKIRQAQGGPRASPSTHPTLETNNQATIKTKVGD